MRLVSVLLCLFAVGVLSYVIGCSCGPEMRRGGGSTDEPATHPPEWVEHVPLEPGTAFHGVGNVTRTDEQALHEAEAAAVDAARDDVLDLIRRSAQSALQRLVPGVLRPDAEIIEEGFSRTVSDQIGVASEAHIEVVDRDSVQDPDSGKTIVFALVAVDFEPVAQLVFEALIDNVGINIQQHEVAEYLAEEQSASYARTRSA